MKTKKRSKRDVKDPGCYDCKHGKTTRSDANTSDGFLAATATTNTDYDGVVRKTYEKVITN